MTISLNSYAEIIDATAVSPVILHAPHGGTLLPTETRDQFRISDAELAAEHLALVDHSTDEMVRQTLTRTEASAVVNKLSRLVVDVERFDGPDEEKNEVGMGVLYTHGHLRQVIRDVPADVSALKAFYRDYAHSVELLTDKALSVHGRAVIIDVHSYWTQPQLHEVHGDDPRPELCVGFDEFHFSPGMRAAVSRTFGWLQQGENQTFRGTYVPLKHLGTDPRVQSVMLEMRRDQYMDEATGAVDAAAVQRISRSLSQLVTDLSKSELLASENEPRHTARP